MTPTLTEANCLPAAADFIAAIPPYPEGRFSGRGIVICANGPIYFTSAYIAIRLLRDHGCTLPVELWHLGQHEVSAPMQALMDGLGVEFVDASEVRKHYHCRVLNGWEIKSFAILHSRFEEVLLIDADNLPLRDPSDLFEAHQYRAYGAVMWPDIFCIPQDRDMWRVAGIEWPGSGLPSCESGQLLFNKGICWEELNLAWWYNDNSDFWYRYHHGDTATWPNAFLKTGREWYQIDALAVGIRFNDLFLQNDFNNAPLFQHQRKWDIRNPPDGRDIIHRDLCEGFFWDLRKRWDGTVSDAPLKPHAITSPDGRERLVLHCPLSPGDVVVLTATIRDLHRAYPGRYVTDVRTPCPAVWENSPYITPIADDDTTARHIHCEYPLIHESNTAPYHFIHGYRQDLERQLGVTIKATESRGDIHLTDKEKGWISQVDEITGVGGTRFWIIVSGGKSDFTAKIWEQARYQEVVNYFGAWGAWADRIKRPSGGEARIQFVQVGEASHNHPPLSGVIDLRGKTDLRQLIRLVYHAEGVVCPVTSLMHLAAAVETKPGHNSHRPCVVVAGAREPAHWEAYPTHAFLHTCGCLPCAGAGGCWRSRVVPLGDGDEKDHPDRLCLRPLKMASGQTIPQCMDMISSVDVIRAIERYLMWEDAK